MRESYLDRLSKSAQVLWNTKLWSILDADFHLNIIE